MYAEIWKSIVGYEGLYEVSDLGRVCSHDRTVFNQSGPYELAGRVLKTRIDRDGYVLVTLTSDGVAKTFKVHRLVLGAFAPRDDASDFEVDHRNGLRSDNRLRNLRWATVSQNRFNIHTVRGRSGKRCVRYREDRPNPWQAYAYDDGRFRSLGHFSTSSEAVAARQAYEQWVRSQ